MKKLIIALMAITTTIITPAFAAPDNGDENANTETKPMALWKQMRIWRVDSNGHGCFAQAWGEDSNTQVILGLALDGSSVIQIYNDKWLDIFLDGQKYNVQIKMDEHAWNHAAPAMSYHDGAVSWEGLSKDAVIDFAEANAVLFTYGGITVDHLSLKGSQEAVMEVLSCLATMRENTLSSSNTNTDPDTNKNSDASY